jgi:hypothetical protein
MFLMAERNIQEANKALMRRWFEEVWNQGRPEAVRREGRNVRGIVEQLRLCAHVSAVGSVIISKAVNHPSRIS